MNESASIARMKKRILAFLKSRGVPCSQSEIYQEVVGRRDVIAKSLSKLCDESVIECFGDGVRSDPRMYTLNERKRGHPFMDQIRIPQTNFESPNNRMEIIV
jgi:hypothetical protein